MGQLCTKVKTKGDDFDDIAGDTAKQVSKEADKVAGDASKAAGDSGNAIVGAAKEQGGGVVETVKEKITDAGEAGKKGVESGAKVAETTASAKVDQAKDTVNAGIDSTAAKMGDVPMVGGAAAGMAGGLKGGVDSAATASKSGVAGGIKSGTDVANVKGDELTKTAITKVDEFAGGMGAKSEAKPEDSADVPAAVKEEAAGEEKHSGEQKLGEGRLEPDDHFAEKADTEKTSEFNEGVGGLLSAMGDTDTTSKVAELSFEWPHGGDIVVVAGSFNEWTDQIPLTKGDDGVFRGSIPVSSTGTYEYKYIVDDEWTTNSDQPMANDNNIQTLS